MSIVRVQPGIAAVVYDESVKGFVALAPGAEYDSADPIVKSHPWAFGSDADRPARGRVTSVSVEQATAAPGEQRTTKRP